MAKRPNTKKADEWVEDLIDLCRKMPRGPQNETAVMRLIAPHTTEPGDALVFLTTLADRPR